MSSRASSAQKILLLLFALIICFIIIEAYYRIFDPFPYFDEQIINKTEQGNLVKYHPLYGWTGVPSGKAPLVTINNSVWIESNSQGYRDIEHDGEHTKPAIVFLGDSFTYGYEVEFDEMFVNILRKELPDYEIYNLAHRGYGTDHELLVFRDWRYEGDLEYVILMFSENDVVDNMSTFRYEKPKPRFEIVNDELVLTGVPVPYIKEWEGENSPDYGDGTITKKIRKFLLKSHFLHDISFRLYIFNLYRSHGWKFPDIPQLDTKLTKRLMMELDGLVKKRGAELLVFFIPSKLETEKLTRSEPYQNQIKMICFELDIKCFDLAEPIIESGKRAYYRQGAHWNANGHAIAADAMKKYLSEGTDLVFREDDASY